MQGRLEATWLDESDCVGAWQSDSLAAVVLPTANTLEQLRRIDAGGDGRRLMLVFNPQWQTDGQIVSDFGCALPFPADAFVHLSSHQNGFLHDAAWAALIMESFLDRALTPMRCNTIMPLASPT